MPVKYIIVLFLSLIFIYCSVSEKDKSKLTRAKTYQVVGKHGITLNNDSRRANVWFITSDAGNFDEFAQTVILAAFEMHQQHKQYDLIQITLVPHEDLIATELSYASAFYAVDKKGLANISGADQNTMTNFKWLVRAAENPLQTKDLVIAKLWYKHMADFPSEDPLSSLSYNKEKLIKFVSDSLRLEKKEIRLPRAILKDYKSLDFLIE